MWLLLTVSGFSLGLYTITLAAAYKKGDLSLVYPLSRGASVCLITAGGILVGGSGSPGAWFCIGVAVLSAGCILLPLRQFREFEIARFANRSCALAMAAAAGIAGYTVLDSVGLRLLSIPIGAAMGILLLKEPRYTPRILGVTMVTGGIAITALV